MAILRSVDGKFYEVPDKDLEKMEIPADQLREKLGDLAEQAGPAGPGPGGPGGGGGGGAQVVIQIHGGADVGGAGGGMGPAEGAGADEEGVEAYGWWRNCWRNCWRNHWRNRWRNCWRNCY